MDLGWFGDGGPGAGIHTPGPDLSEAALRYGLRMLERSGGGLRPAVRTHNVYERRLLAEVGTACLESGRPEEKSASETRTAVWSAF